MVRILRLATLLLASTFALSQSNPDEAIAKSNQLYAQHHFHDAAWVLRDTIKKNPDCFRCYVGLAIVSIRTEDQDSALDSVTKAIKVATNDNMRATGHFYKGLLFYSGNKKQLLVAEQEFRDALALDPKCIEAQLDLGITLLRQSRQEEGLAEIRKYVDAPEPKNDLSYAKKILANPRVARDSLAPDFSVLTAQGENFSLAASAGKVVVIDFWATWCGPCRESVPEIKELLKKYPPEKLTVLSACADSKEKDWRETIDKRHMNWAQYFDEDGHLAEMFSVNGFPTYVVVDRDGFIRKRLVGMDPQNSLVHQLRGELKSLLE